MSYLNRENHSVESPTDHSYPDSEPVQKTDPEQATDRPTPLAADLSTFSTAALFDVIINRAVDGRVDAAAEQIFTNFAATSEARNKRWAATGARPYSVLERAAEMGGEAGEVLNVAKKLLRYELGMVGNYKPGDTTDVELIAQLEYEMGDVLVTLFNLQNKVPGVSLLRGFRRAFNEKSEQLGFPERV
jgi:hypothetical protein